MTDADREEHDQMQACLERIDDTLGRIGQRVAEYQTESQASHDHMWEARRDMDHIEVRGFAQLFQLLLLRPQHA